MPARYVPNSWSIGDKITKPKLDRLEAAAATATAPLTPQASTGTPGALTVGNYYVFTAAAGALAPVLPALSTVTDGDILAIEKDYQDTTANPVVVTCAAGDTFPTGATTSTLTSFGERLRLQAATIGATRVWKVLDHYQHPAAVAATYLPLITATAAGVTFPDTGWGVASDGSPTFYGVGAVPAGQGAYPTFLDSGAFALIPTGA